MILTCISVISNIEHLFLYHLAICIYFLGKWLFRSFDHILIGLFGGFVIDLYRFVNIYIFWIFTPYYIHRFSNFFSHFMRIKYCLFILVMVFMICRNFSVWCNPTCLCFLLCFWCQIQKIIIKTYVKLSICVFSRSFMVSYLMLKSL